MHALQSHPDILAIAVLGQRDTILPSGREVLANVRVIDTSHSTSYCPAAQYIVVNSGYGGVQHAIGYGMPLYITSWLEEKLDAATRAELAGIAVNLRTGRPNEEALDGAVEEVLKNPQYKERAMDMKEKTVKSDTIRFIAEVIEEGLKEQAESGASMKSMCHTGSNKFG
jgi:UDP:flavonoid glycosyltransferase YjiC (YdhE family)